jgi:hypothetical protein
MSALRNESTTETGATPSRSTAAVWAILVIAALASGCGSHDSVLDEGVHVGSFGRVYRIGPTQAVTAVRRARADWERELASRARAYPQQTFANVPEPVLRDRLAAFVRRYDFEVMSLHLRRPRQLAPDIVVRTSDYLELAHALPLILKQLDPKVRTNDDRTGWRFEGFFLEAGDEHGVPFAAVFNFWRGSGGGGGQFTRSDALFPFAHL